MYKQSRFGVTPFFKEKDFNPAGVFIIYLERVAMLHANQNTLHDYLFPNIVIKQGFEYLCDAQNKGKITSSSVAS